MTLTRIRITQVSRVERSIEIEVDDPEPYIEGDFITPDSSDHRWNDKWDLQNEEVKILDSIPPKPGDPGFEWPACSECGSRSLRCGCD